MKITLQKKFLVNRRGAAFASYIFVFLACVGSAFEVRAEPLEVLVQEHLQEGTAHTTGEPEEIIVTGHRLEPVLTVEKEFDEDDIAADGADTIGELLGSLRPFIDPAGRDPVVLINGRPAGFDSSINSYPVEALEKVTVLAASEAQQYGARSGTPVINLMLKRNFASLHFDTSLNAATTGGQYGTRITLSRSAIDDETRWTVRVQAGTQSALLRSEREIPLRSINIAQAPNIVELPVNSEVFEAVQRAAVAGPLKPGDFETLQPSSRNVTAGISVTRPLGTLSATLSLDGSSNFVHGLRGVPGIAFSPLEGNPADNETMAAFGHAPLRNDNHTRTFSGSFTLSGTLKTVQTNISANVSLNEGSNAVDFVNTEEGLRDILNLNQGAVDLSSFLNSDLTLSQLTDTQSSIIHLRLNLRKAAVQLPAGLISWSFSGSRIQGRSSYEQRGSSQISRRSRFEQSGLQASIGVPLSSRGSAMDLVGDLSADFSVGRQNADGGDAQMSYGAAVTWAPISEIQFRGSIDRTEDAPSAEQLNAPLLIVQDNVFDYVTQAIVQVSKTTGGNPSLERGRQSNLSLSFQTRPFSQNDVAVNVTYRRLVRTNGSIGFPDLSPAIESAFPERILRDSTGRLISIDARPISLQRQTDATLTSSFTLRLSKSDRVLSALPQISEDFRLSLSVRYQLSLESLGYIRDRLSPIDRLAESGEPRHRVQLSFGAGTRAFAGRITTNWRNETMVSSETQRFLITPPVPVNLALTFRLEHLSDGLRDHDLARGTEISLDVQNIFRSYRRVRLADGSTPIGYTRYEVDPVGRTVSLTLRKSF